MKRSEILFGILKVPMDFLMTIMAFLAAYKLRLLTESISWIAKPIDYTVLPTLKEYFNFSLITSLGLVAIFALNRMYTIKTTAKFSQEIRRSMVICGIWAMAMITYFFFTRTFPFSRLALF